jgi:RNA polymerase-binding transcription factor DksA
MASTGDDGPEQVGAVRERLLGLRQETLARHGALQADLTGIVEASRDTVADDEHDPDGATIAFERAQVDALSRGALARLAEIDTAIARLDAGTYGTCEVCGEPIAAARLEARPTAARCLACASTRR